MNLGIILGFTLIVIMIFTGGLFAGIYIHWISLKRRVEKQLKAAWWDYNREPNQRIRGYIDALEFVLKEY